MNREHRRVAIARAGVALSFVVLAAIVSVAVIRIVGHFQHRVASVAFAAVPSDSDGPEESASTLIDQAKAIKKIDGPAEWKKAAEDYKKNYRPLAPDLKERYTIVNLYGDLSKILYEQKDFAAVEEELQKRLAKISDPWAAYDYQRIVDNLGGLEYDYEPEQMLATTQKWTEEHPASHFAWLIRGILSTRYAWYWRGNGYAQTITEQGGEEFAKYMGEAYQHLNRAHTINPRDPAISEELLEVAMEASFSENLFALYFDRVTSICPSYYSAYFTKLRHLTPKWGGSWEEIDAFVDECDKKSADLHDPMLRWIRIDAYAEMAYGRDGYKKIRETPEFKAANLAADRDVLKAWPDEIEPHANYCRLLYNQGKYSEALEQFKWLGDRWYHPSRWASVAQYNTDRAYTLYKCADDVADRDERIARLREAIKLSPRRGDYYFRLALEYRKVKDYEETEKIYLQGMDAQPREARNWLALAGLYQELGRYEDLQDLAEASRDQKFDEKYQRTLEEIYVIASTHIRK
jgi:hypothetical protein